MKFILVLTCEPERIHNDFLSHCVKLFYVIFEKRTVFVLLKLPRLMGVLILVLISQVNDRVKLNFSYLSLIIKMAVA